MTASSPWWRCCLLFPDPVSQDDPDGDYRGVGDGRGGDSFLQRGLGCQCEVCEGVSVSETPTPTVPLITPTSDEHHNDKEHQPVRPAP